MRDLPHDTDDVLLAPVAIGLNRLLESLGELSVEDLELQIALQTDREPTTVERRRTLLLDLLRHNVDVRGWELSWCERGLAVTHERYQLVLGLSPALAGYLAPRPAALQLG